MIWRRNREPTITVQGDILGDVQAPVVSKQIEPQLDADARQAAARLPHRNGRRDRRERARPGIR